MGLMNTDDYFNLIYDKTGATGPDLGQEHTKEDFNLNGYFPRIKELNEKIIDKNEEIIALSTDLTELEA
jgi:hypothetical protein